MAKTKFAELIQLSREDLVKKAETLRTEISALARGTKAGDVQNVRAYGHKRRELARVLTAIGQISTIDSSAKSQETKEK